MGKRILIAPLDWGLGHATRCIPIIRRLLETGNSPIIASAGRPLDLLRKEFPDVETVTFDGYDISYPEGSGMVWKMSRSVPVILKRISAEHTELQSLIPELRLDGVISDNRFGLYSDLVPCAYITHQVMIKAPFFEPVLYRLHRRFMDRYTEAWVPDHEHDGLAGDLSHKYPLPGHAKFIGPLTRFRNCVQTSSLDVLVIVSGPEPQRTRFQKLVLHQLEEFEGRAMAVLGTPEQTIDRVDGKGHRIVSHLDADRLQDAMAGADVVVSRSGYSTLMDLSALGKKAIFVPTPGQTEQEYLAKRFHRSGIHLSMTQRSFNLQEALRLSDKFTGFEMRSASGYMDAVDSFVATLS